MRQLHSDFKVNYHT